MIVFFLYLIILTSLSSQQLPFSVCCLEFLLVNCTGSHSFINMSIVGPDPPGPERYRVLYFYRPIPNTLKVDFVVAVLYNDPNQLKYVRREFAGYTEDKQVHSVVFNQDEIVLAIPHDEPLDVGDWRIIPLSFPRITEVDVRHCRPGRPLPACTIEMEWIGSGEPKPLFHRVRILGAKEPDNFFFMRYYPQPVGVTPVTATDPRAKHCSSSSSSQLEGDSLHQEPTLRDLLNMVASKAVDKWMMFGVQLNIDQTTLQQISYQENPIRCYVELFTLWRQRQEPPFTWNSVIDILRTPIVDEFGLAEAIEEWLHHDK